MRYQWADGFHPPKSVSADVVRDALDKLKEPSPENLLHASKSKRHVLHDDLWAEGDQVWAQRGRLERCRKIIASICEVTVVGGKEITVRSVEFVRSNGSGSWMAIDNIVKDAEMRDAYMADIIRLQEQAAGKMAKFRELLAAA